MSNEDKVSHTKTVLAIPAQSRLSPDSHISMPSEVPAVHSPCCRGVHARAYLHSSVKVLLFITLPVSLMCLLISRAIRRLQDTIAHLGSPRGIRVSCIDTATKSQRKLFEDALRASKRP
eukprot:gnl/TRDRNA2_/TRDRNA2_122558_c0_seq1.p2 gnl/TRDRNA2_/TRDRNA2_122558_c0~~gnl/TRDRNA2_/TRDRNA2_122558_c0_seq1.p2  ORF type:complete len:119 (+),score=11.34 gnl/TRDRNA2_/TRDRNA2_122558_c0_seq1:354-710(+)